MKSLLSYGLLLVSASLAWANILSDSIFEAFPAVPECVRGCTDTMPLPISAVVSCAGDEDAIACLCAREDLAMQIYNCSTATTCPKKDQEQALANIEEVCADHSVELDFAALAASASASEVEEQVKPTKQSKPPFSVDDQSSASRVGWPVSMILAGLAVLFMSG